MNGSTTTIDDLAAIIKGEFDNVHKEIGMVKSDVEEILIKLDNKADRFEVKDLEKRMGKVEGKLSIV